MSARVWSGHAVGPAASVLSGLTVWTNEEGYALSARLPDGRLAILASTSDSPDASGVPAGACPVTVSTDDLGRLIPVGFALLVDGAAPGRRIVSADVLDGLRVAEPPDGTEPDLELGPVPPHAAAVAEDAKSAALAAGSKHATAVWAQTPLRRGLWISLDRAPDQAYSAALDAVSRHAPAEPVRVHDYRDLPRQAQSALFAALSREPDADEAQPFTGKQNVLILVVCLFGALLIALGREAQGSQGITLVAAGWAVEAALILGVIVVAAGRGFAIPGVSGGKVRPLPLLGFLLVAGGLLWQAARAS